jgi:putative PIN family toxin of toxin-antitoxin system
MIKVVIDTNVVVSANLVDEGPSAAILDLAANKIILMFVSPAILAEYEEVLRRPRLKIESARIADSLAVIRNTSTEVVPTHILKISAHEPDNRFYECAEAARADYLITGNTKDFGKDHKTTKIITPRDFIHLIISELAQAEE